MLPSVFGSHLYERRDVIRAFDEAVDIRSSGLCHNPCTYIILRRRQQLYHGGHRLYPRNAASLDQGNLEMVLHNSMPRCNHDSPFLKPRNRHKLESSLHIDMALPTVSLLHPVLPLYLHTAQFL
jgi:hypothetical protein